MRVAPGVRLSASPRGIRGHVGPRVARVHVGGGRPGISTGAGPLTVYEPLSASSRQSTQGMTAKQAERAQQVENAVRHFAHLENMHRQQFGGSVREIVTTPTLAKFGKLLATAEKRTLHRVSPLDRETRKARRVEARQLAERWALDLMALAENERRSRQDSVDREWTALHANEPEAVRRALAAASKADARPVRVLGVEGGEAHLTVRVDGPQVVPDSKPATTPSGAPTLRKVTKADRAAWHRQIVASQVLLAAKEALAVAPALHAVRLVAVDHAGIPLLGARLQRPAIVSADWSEDAWRILSGLDGDLRCDLRGRTQELRTIDLTGDRVYGRLVSV